MEPKDVLLSYLEGGREAVLWKLEGLSEYDLRRPMTATGTNLLGLVKHLASVELGYLGEVMGRPSGVPLPWYDEPGQPPNADMFATADESVEQIVELYRGAGRHSAATVAALDLDAPGRVPWWGERGDVTLHQVLVHLIAETHRHAGHADIVREAIDGAAGMRPGVDNLAELDAAGWAEQHRELQAIAERFREHAD
ncbi:MAG: DinB family protein [Micropruina sp.]|uniref:DinB family protein n=1 Tax=Micropruina sp. TaxID=2737536 RepID=UPI0039E72959